MHLIMQQDEIYSTLGDYKMGEKGDIREGSCNVVSTLVTYGQVATRNPMPVEVSWGKKSAAKRAENAEISNRRSPTPRDMGREKT